MINPQHLLAVARDLANLESHRPRQASLRRAVSSAYHALFHLLIRSSVDSQVGFGPTTTHREIGETMVRWYTHTRMAADYDPSKNFTRQGVLTQVDQAEQAFKDWEIASADPFRPVFLLLLLIGDEVIKDR